MNKSKLQELCQKRRWDLPVYTTVKVGPGHMPRFTTTVTVHGRVFETPAKCRSAKEAENTAARVAFDHINAPSSPPPISSAAGGSQFHGGSQNVSTPPPQLPSSPPPSSLPIPSSGLMVTKNDANAKPANGEVLQQNCQDTAQTSMVYKIALGSLDERSKDTLHMYKNQLQQYAQKKSLGLPMYASEAEGPPHARRFKSRVSLDGKSYETLEFFSTIKEAEQAAAKVACQALAVDVVKEDGILYKNLLQEFAQKNGLLCPSYDTVSSGMSHNPLFVSTVEVGSDTFRGADAKTKKQAEMNAAKVAFCALTKSCSATEPSKVSSVDGCAVADNFPENIHRTATTENHHDGTSEEAQAHAKRAKSSPDVNVNAHLPGLSNGNSPSNLLHSQVENSASGEHVNELPIENGTSLDSKTLVFPRNSSLAKPDSAYVMPCSNDQWVAYRVGVDQQPTNID